MNVIIITGTSKGIGHYLANTYLEINENIVVGCSRSDSKIINERYYHYKIDISDENAVIKMCKDIYRKFKQIDILINNAGIASMNHSLLTPNSVVSKLFNTNFLGTFAMCREVSKLMSIHKFGRIVNFSTVAVPLYLEGEMAYASTKAAVETLTRILAKELADSGITCNCVGPSPIDTDLIKNVSHDKINKLINLQSIHKKATFEDVKNVVDFFISKNSQMITGQFIYLGGIF